MNMPMTPTTLDVRTTAATTAAITAIAEMRAIEAEAQRLRDDAAALSMALRALLARQDAWRVAVLVADEFRRAQRLEALLCAVDEVLSEVSE